MRCLLRPSLSFCSLLCGMLLAFVSPLRAQAPAAAPEQADASYEQVLAEAVRAHKEQRWLEARALFERANTLRPNARTLRGMGVCAFEAHLYALSARDLEAALANPERPLVADLRRSVESLLVDARNEVAVYHFHLEPEGAELAVDGRAPVLSALGEVLLDPGKHEVQVHWAGFPVQTVAVDARRGEHSEVQVILPPAPAPIVVQDEPKDEPYVAPSHSYAILIGSNAGGQGHDALSFAVRDAERMAQVLGELGHVERENVTLLRQPKISDVENTLGRVRAELKEHAQRGERSQLLFYYSGHARTNALSLGAEELDLAKLREDLQALPGTLTVAVLDACQSGAFSRVKSDGTPADFSHSSVNGLGPSGVAVLASSTPSELSQESEQLSGSYFTTHLIAALRGAGDKNYDGRVSLDEAYRYAYEHTLLDTSRTAVGGQHATLETAFKGKENLTLSFPGEANGKLVIASNLQARVLVSQHGSMVTEVVKTRGAQLTLALPAGSYRVIVHEDHESRACNVRVSGAAFAELTLSQCKHIAEPEDPLHPRPAPLDRLFLEAGFSVRGLKHDDYVSTLHDFNFEHEKLSRGIGTLRLGTGLSENFALFARYDRIAHVSYRRDADDSGDPRQDFSWTSRFIGAGLRGRYPLLHGYFVPYADLAGGLGFARTLMSSEHIHYIKHFYGFSVTGVAGFMVHTYKPWLGVFAEFGYTYAPLIKNLLGDRHDDGSFVFTTGLRVAYAVRR